MIPLAFVAPGGVLASAALVLALSGNGSAPATPPADEWKRETDQWFESVQAGATLRVVNPIGDVHARFGGYEHRAEIIASAQWLESAVRPEVSARRTEAGLELVTTASSTEDGDESRRIDLVVFVPVGVALDVQTEHDRIEVKGVKGDVVASSETGEIRIRSVEGRVRAKSARGALFVTLESGVTREPQDFSTVTGDIECYLWDTADMTVRIATSGEISTDFSLEIEHRPSEEPAKRALAVIGEGGGELTLSSKRGRVRLLRLDSATGRVKGTR